jgi:DNA repair exonuclease SbcCD nuclease subunit
MRILHLADLHLDTSFAGRSPRIRARLREAVRQSLERAVELALDEQVQAFLIAGDLFDGTRLSFESEQLLVRQLRRLTEAGIVVIYATGNHDPGASGRSRRSIPWPEGMTVVGDGTPRRMAVRDAEGAVVGWVTAAGHASARETRDLAAAFPKPVGELPQVALLHSQVVGSRDSEGHEPYAPTTVQVLEAAGYDYWALGHVHLRQALCDFPGVHYAGNPQGRTPRESGPKGVLLVDVAHGFTPQVEFRPIAPVRWEDLVLEDPDAESLESLLRLVRSRWTETREMDPDPDAEWMVRVVVRGSTPLWREFGREEDCRHLAGELEALLGVLEVRIEVRGVHPPVDVEQHRGREDTLGLALRLVDEASRGELESLGIDLELAGASDPEEIREYLAAILEGADADLVSRFVLSEDP